MDTATHNDFLTRYGLGKDLIAENYPLKQKSWYPSALLHFEVRTLYSRHFVTFIVTLGRLTVTTPSAHATVHHQHQGIGPMSHPPWGTPSSRC